MKLQIYCWVMILKIMLGPATQILNCLMKLSSNFYTYAELAFSIFA
jgi:hypothetical protein